MPAIRAISNLNRGAALTVMKISFEIKAENGLKKVIQLFKDKASEKNCQVFLFLFTNLIIKMEQTLFKLW